MKGRLIIGAGVALLVALSVIWFRTNFERVQVK